MGNIDWLPIETAPRDGTRVLLWGEAAGEINGPYGENDVHVGAYLYAGRSDYAGYEWSCEADAYGLWVKATHWAEINPPGQADKAREDYEVYREDGSVNLRGLNPGIPIHPTALVEKGIPGLATIHDATGDVLGKDGE